MGLSIQPKSDDTLITDLRRHDRERYLSTLWAPAAARPALQAIHAFDLELQRIVVDAREPMLAEIRIAWWCEQLESIGHGATVPAQPLLQALATAAATSGFSLSALARVGDGFRPLLQDRLPDALSLAYWRGEPLFQALAFAALGRPLTGDEAESAATAGTRWVLAQLWRGQWGQAERLLQQLDPPAFPEPTATPLPATLRTLDALAADDWQRMIAKKPLRQPASAMRQWIALRAAL